MQIDRQGWGVEDDLYVHLASEAAVDENGTVSNLEDQIVSEEFLTLERAFAFVEQRSETHGHVSQWPVV